MRQRSGRKRRNKRKQWSVRYLSFLRYSTGVVFRNYGVGLLNVKNHVTWTHSGKTTTTNGGSLMTRLAAQPAAPRLIIYPCDGPGLTTFSQQSVASSGGGIFEGSGKCGGSNGSAVLAQALKFCGFTYTRKVMNNPGNLWTVACRPLRTPHPGVTSTASGLVNVAHTCDRQMV